MKVKPKTTKKKPVKKKPTKKKSSPLDVKIIPMDPSWWGPTF